jgi:hypothetical protein
MKCSNTDCSLNCFGYCQHIGHIIDDIEFGGYPEPDGCFETEKYDLETKRHNEEY